MTDDNNASIKECFHIKYDGLDAADGRIPLDHIMTSLNGWYRFWRLASGSFLQGKLTNKALPPENSPKIILSTPQRGSFDIAGDIIIPLILMGGYDLIKQLIRWRQKLLMRQVKSKRGLITKEEAVKALESLAKDNKVDTDDKASTVHFLDALDESMKDIVMPISLSANTINFSSNKQKTSLHLGAKEKRDIISPYHVPPEMLDPPYVQTDVYFLRIHKETGNAIIEFVHPDDIDQYGHQYAHINDDNVNKPKNPYARAYYEGEPLSIWAKKIRKKQDGTFALWEICVNEPNTDLPLLESNKEEE